MIRCALVSSGSLREFAQTTRPPPGTSDSQGGGRLFLSRNVPLGIIPGRILGRTLKPGVVTESG